MADTPAIETAGLSKTYAGAIQALVGLDLRVERGEVFGYLGPNGAGKSTTIRLLLDLIRATEGSAEVLGLDSRRSALDIHRRTGYLPGELALSKHLTAREHLEYFGSLRGGLDRDYANGLAERFDLALDRVVGSLSRGNKQKVGLLLAFAHRPELLVLDEPTSGLDPLMQQTFNSLVRETVDEGRTVFLSSHVLSEVQHDADRVGIIRDGSLVAVEDVRALRGRALRELEIRFAGAAPREPLAAVPGVRDVRTDGPVAHLLVEGSPDALVKELARHEIADLISHEPDLEDVFLSYYSDAVDAS
jgi:ABC-2 type transport system ATP-binding protein